MSATPASTHAAPATDVVVVAYECRELLLACCRSVAALAGVRLLVVDNDSSDGSADAVEQAFPDATVLRAPHNEGFAAGVNRGLAASNAEQVLLLNPDARLAPGALDRMRAALRDDPRCAAVGPRLRDADGALELSVDRTMTPLGDLRTRLLDLLYAGGSGPLARILERRYSRARDVRSLSGACMLLRRTALREVGGLDARFFLYAEDVDLCRRLRAAAWRLRYEPGAEAVHVRGASARHDPLAVEAAWRDSQLAFYREHLPLWAPLLRAWVRWRYRWRSRFGSPARRARARAMLDRIDGGGPR